MYLTKNSIEHILFKKEVNKSELSKNLFEILFLFNLDHNDQFSEEVYGMVKEGITYMIEIVNEKLQINGKDISTVLIDLFKSIWKLLATYNLYSTMEGNLGFDRSVINTILQEKSLFYKQELIDQCMV